MPVRTDYEPRKLQQVRVGDEAGSEIWGTHRPGRVRNRYTPGRIGMKKMILSHIRVAYTECEVYQGSGCGSDEFGSLQEVVVHLALLSRICVVPASGMTLSGGTEQLQQSRLQRTCNA